jgi:hypothetical protein
MVDVRSHGKSPNPFLLVRFGLKICSGIKLSCNIHTCPQRCHQLKDHSKMNCGAVLHDKCPQGHPRSWKCHKPPPSSCLKCEREAEIAEKKRQKDFAIQQKRDEELREHQKQMALLDEEIEREKQKIKDDQERRAREIAIQQKRKDLEDAAATAARLRQSVSQSLFSSFPFRQSTPSAPLPPALSTPADPQQSQPSTQNEPNTQPSTPATSNTTETRSKPGNTTNIPLPGPSLSEKEWQRQKDFENANNDAIDQIMEMIGLEDVKSQVLKIKAKIDTAIRQDTDFKDERFGVTLLGNPGTGTFILKSNLQ